jgi:hypothetical protein
LITVSIVFANELQLPEESTGSWSLLKGKDAELLQMPGL